MAKCIGKATEATASRIVRLKGSENGR